jgi:hypothetical protein
MRTRWGRARNRQRGLGWVWFSAILGFLVINTAVRGQTREESAVRQAKNESCREERIPLIIRGAIALVEIGVNGKTATFIVDSAGTTMINSDRLRLDVVDQLHLGQITAQETAPLEPWNVVEIKSMKFGKEELRDVRILSRSLPHLEKQLLGEVDGILGADLLTHWDAVALDYRHREMRLGRTSCLTSDEELKSLSWLRTHAR